MGLLDHIFPSTDEPKAEDFTPVEAVANPNTITAPVTGAVINRIDVESDVFAQGLLGRGCGIRPQEDVIYAPANGTVTVQYAGSRHAFGMASDGGAQIVVHVGLGTVAMEGKGFTYLVHQGDSVKAGQPVLAFSREAITEAGYDPIVTIAIVNSDDFSRIELVQQGHVDAGQILFELEN
ncbi:PTS glucose transporter subunit IIA [Olsenella sp. KGMB02461]|nr:PTS glucose transporter subunit IIA [Olsenella sp. KGMB02461]